MLNLDIVQGTEDDWDLQPQTQFGPTTDLEASDTFTAKLWRGGNDVTLFAPAVTWIAADSLNFEITAAQSSTLNYGVTYWVEIYRQRVATKNCIGLLHVTCVPAPR